MELLVKIAGTNRTTSYIKDSLDIKNVINQRIDTCKLDVEDTTGSITISNWDEIIISNTGETVRYFAGFIMDIEHPLAGVTKVFRCRAQDYTVLLDRVIVNISYAGKTDAFIINALCTVYLSDVDGSTNGISYYGYYEKQSTMTIGDLSGTIGEQTWRFGDREILEAVPTTLFGDTDGYIYEYDRLVSNDDGTTIDAWFSTKDFMFTQLMERQIVLRMDVYFGGEGDLKVAYSTDFGDTWTSERTLAGQDTYAVSRAYWRIDCGLVRFRFRNNNAGEHFDFREARIYWQPSGQRF